MSACLALTGFAAAAHPLEQGHVELPWTFEPWVLIGLALSVALYVVGLARMWKKAGAGAGVTHARAACHLLGLLTVGAALVSPLDALGSYLFSAHMAQHELLMIVAAPLIVLGRPLAVWAWALPPKLDRTIAGASANRILKGCWNIVSYAPAAWVLHALALWCWHVPAWFDAALHNEAIHTVQHLSFFLTALLFWWAPLGSTSRTQRGVALIYVFTTMVHTTILGALLTVAPTPWYGYGEKAEVFGWPALDDQQLGGLIMWVPGGLVYVAASLAIAWQSLKGKNDCLEPQASR